MRRAICTLGVLLAVASLAPAQMSDGAKDIVTALSSSNAQENSEKPARHEPEYGRACLTPPSFDEALSPTNSWQVTTTKVVDAGSCYLFKIPMLAANGYDFSVCVNDAVGGSADPGDGDFTMKNASGTQLWYIDGLGSCSFDASTLGSAYPNWHPASDGDYFLMVDEYYGGTITFTLAYKMTDVPTGACCYADYTCAITTQAACPDTWLGANTLCAACPPPPAPENDNCTNATAIGEVTDLPFNTTSATHDGAGTCMTSANVWYCYTPTCTGDVIVDLCGSLFDTKLAVYEGCSCDPLGAELGCNDDSFDFCGTLQSSLSISVVAGQQYLIEVGGYSSASGSGDLTITCPSLLGACCRNYNESCEDDVLQADCAGEFDTWYAGQACETLECPAPPPPNDLCANAEPIQGPYPVTVAGTTIGATVDCPDVLNLNLVWYTIDLPCELNDVTVTYCGTSESINSVLIVYFDMCDDCGNYHYASTFEFGACLNGLTGATVTYTGVTGPRTIWLPAYVDNGSGQGMDFSLTVNVTSNCDDGDPCTDDSCDPATGECIHTPVNCDDLDPCTDDSCDPLTGECIHTPVNCDDLDPCTDDSCDPLTGECIHTPVNCDDGDACTDDSCDPLTGECIHTPIVCDDFNPCTDDSCDPLTGECIHTPVNCDDGDACTDDSCDPLTGECIHTPIVCNDFDPCTSDACVDGVCVYTPILGACCHTNGSCEPTTQCACTDGDWLGAGTTCDLCPQPPQTAACCAPDSSCTPTTEADCLPPNVWHAEWADCFVAQCQAPPTGETCDTAIQFPPLPATVTGSTVGHANDYDEVCPYTGSTSPDVVYYIDSFFDVYVTIDLCASGYDTKVYVYQDACDSPPIACNDDYCPGYRSYLECMPLPTGHRYYIVIDGYGGASGNYALTIAECPPPATGSCCYPDGSCAETLVENCTGVWTMFGTCTPNTCPPPPTGACCRNYNEFCEDGILQADCAGPHDTWYSGLTCAEVTCPTPPPPGDTCLDAIVVDALPYTAPTGTTTGFMNDYTPPPSCGYSLSAPDVVYAYTPAGDECINISLCGSSFDTILHVMAPCGVDIACDDDSAACGLQSEILGLNLVAGTTYYIVVDGYYTYSGDYALTIVACPSTGACCRNYNEFCEDGILQADCAGPHDTWFEGQTCVQVTCPPPPPPTGACCRNYNELCQDGITQADCAGPHDTWFDGQTCAEVICPLPLGACCYPDGTCQTTLEADCPPAAIWHLGTDCNDFQCPPPSATLDLDTNVDVCYHHGETIEVAVDMKQATVKVIAGQFFLSYDSSKLHFESIVPGDPPFDTELYQSVGDGTIDYAVRVALGDPGTLSDTTMARITFTAIGDVCNVPAVVSFRDHAPPTDLTDGYGNAVPLTLHNLSRITIDSTPPEVTCPADILLYPNVGDCGAYVTWPPATALDNCDGWLPATCDPPSGALFPLGTTMVTCQATDACGNIGYCSFNVTVQSFNPLNVALDLCPTIAAANLDRCITFVLWNCSGGSTTVEEVLSFFDGSAQVVLQVPCGGPYTCITARDKLHTLQRTLNPLPNNGTEYTADFSGRCLIGGNLNDDTYIDILDFGVLMSQWNHSYGTGNTTCVPPTMFPHGDINGDGFVDAADFTFIQINFLQGNEADCCELAGLGVAGPLTRISLAELQARGLGALAVGDLNSDGWLDEADIVAFMNGARPQQSTQAEEGATSPVAPPAHGVE